MKKIAVLMVLVSSWLSSPAMAVSNEKQMPAIMDAYLKIQTALANDSLTGISAAAAEIAKVAKSDEIKKPAQALGQDSTLKSAREHFKKLSVPLDQWAKETKPSGVDRVTCSMAGASWLQKKGEIQNPYYGKQMQGCGEVQN